MPWSLPARMWLFGFGSGLMVSSIWKQAPVRITTGPAAGRTRPDRTTAAATPAFVSPGSLGQRTVTSSGWRSFVDCDDKPW